MLRLFSGSALIRVCGAAAQLLFTLLVSRTCDSSQAGLFFFGYSILFILSTLVRLGSELSGLRTVAHLLASGDGRAVRRSVETRMAVVLGAGLLAGALLFGVSPFVASQTFGAPATWILGLTSLTIPAFALIGLLSEILKGAGRAWIALTVQNIAIPAVTVPAVVVFGALGSPTARDVTLATACATWIVAGVSVWVWGRVFRKRFGGVEPGLAIDRREIRQILREAPSLLIVSTTSVLMQWIGATLLGFLAPASEVAGYSVAMRISIAVSIVHSAAASIVGPQMAVAHAAGDVSQLRRVSQRTGLLIMSITWPGLLAMMIFAPLCMSVFGRGYADFSYVLRILLAGQLVAAVIGHSGLVLVMAGRYASARLSSVIAATSLGILSIVTMPILGAAGAAVSMSAAVVLGHLAGILLARRDLSLWTIATTKADLVDALRHAPRDPSQGVIAGA